MAIEVGGDLHRRLHAIVLTNERRYTCLAADNDSSGPTVFNNNKALLAVGIELLRFAYPALLDDTLDS